MSNKNSISLNDEQINKMNDTKKGCLIGMWIMILIFCYIAYQVITLSNKEKQIFVHNPYDFDMDIQINDLLITLNPNSREVIELEEGVNNFISKIKDSILIDTSLSVPSILFDKGGLINLSKQSYYLLTQTYSHPIFLDYTNSPEDNGAINSSNVLDEIADKSMKIIQVDTTLMVGDFEKIEANQIVMIKNWDFDLNEKFPSSIKKSKNYELISNATKLFSKPELLIFWENLMQEANEEENSKTWKERL